MALLKIPRHVWEVVDRVVDPIFRREVQSHLSLGKSLDKAVFELVTGGANAKNIEDFSI